MDSGGNVSGFDIDAARWIAELKGFDVRFVAVPWENAISDLESGRIDMIYIYAILGFILIIIALVGVYGRGRS